MYTCIPVLLSAAMELSVEHRPGMYSCPFKALGVYGESHPRQLIFLWKSDCLGCVVLLCLVVCMHDLAGFFHLSLTCVQCTCIVVYPLRIGQYEEVGIASHPISEECIRAFLGSKIDVIICIPWPLLF